MSNDSIKTSGNVEKHFFRASAADFKKIPGSPIAYWVSTKAVKGFANCERLELYSDIKTGMQTGDNELFLRFWSEVSSNKINPPNVQLGNNRWHLYSKGGDFRRWYGNVEHVVDWNNDGYAIRNLKVNGSLRSRVRDISNYFRNAASWSFVSSAYFGCRYKEPGIFFDVAGSCALESKIPIELVLGYLCSKLSTVFLNALNPTLNFQIQDIANLPYQSSNSDIKVVKDLINTSKFDWNAYETSWDFTYLPLLNSQTVGRVSDSTCVPEGITQQPEATDVGLRDKATNPTYPLPLSIKETYTQLRAHWQEMTMEMQRLEEENNNIFINAYGLQDELTPEVPLKEITITCNPHYRYGNNKNPEELETLLLADTLKEFISYAVGCMFGRYALDKPGLILANQGETLADYLKQIPEPIFSADDDNVIPMLDGDWFTDDVTERFGKFLKVTFGEAHYEENLKYIEQALGKDIRKYFLKDFYNDHLKRYKKRPIYWLFSSPKGTFNALIYLHRYRSDTVSVVLNDYLREFRAKLSAHKVHLEAVSISGSASASEKTKALKDIENHRKMLDELDTYEREVLYPLATEQLEIDLDDGVKVNYQKFGEALKKIPGLAAKED